jgi:conjugative transfer region protein TrbK
MSRCLTPRQFTWIAIAGFTILTGALVVIRSLRGENVGIVASLERDEALASELARCRAVRLDQPASLENCHRVWEKNRRQFFKPTETSRADAQPVLTAADNQGRVSPVEAEGQQGEVR